MFSRRLKELREKKGISQEKLARDLGIPRSSVTHYEVSDDRLPRQERLNKIAEYFGVSIDYLLGRTDQKHYYDLTEKDEKEVKKELERMVNDMDAEHGYAKYNDGEPMNDKDKELLKASLENSLKIARMLAKKKFTPKKYR